MVGREWKRLAPAVASVAVLLSRLGFAAASASADQQTDGGPLAAVLVVLFLLLIFACSGAGLVLIARRNRQREERNLAAVLWAADSGTKGASVDSDEETVQQGPIGGAGAAPAPISMPSAVGVGRGGVPGSPSAVRQATGGSSDGAEGSGSSQSDSSEDQAQGRCTRSCWIGGVRFFVESLLIEVVGASRNMRGGDPWTCVWPVVGLDHSKWLPPPSAAHLTTPHLVHFRSLLFCRGTAVAAGVDRVGPAAHWSGARPLPHLYRPQDRAPGWRAQVGVGSACVFVLSMGMGNFFIWSCCGRWGLVLGGG